MGSVVTLCNASLITRGKARRQCPQTTDLKRKECWSQIKVMPTSLPALRHVTKPNQLTVVLVKVFSHFIHPLPSLQIHAIDTKGSKFKSLWLFLRHSVKATVTHSKLHASREKCVCLRTETSALQKWSIIIIMLLLKGNNAHSHTQVHAWAHTHTHSYARMHKHSCACMCACAHTHTHVRTHTHACAHTHTHTHTHLLQHTVYIQL